MPGKKAILAGILTAAVVLVIYNKVPAVKRALGGAA